jgi:hypothetical protein
MARKCINVIQTKKKAGGVEVNETSGEAQFLGVRYLGCKIVAKKVPVTGGWQRNSAIEVTRPL